jgi:hypothetical protein
MLTAVVFAAAGVLLLGRARDGFRQSRTLDWADAVAGRPWRRAGHWLEVGLAAGFGALFIILATVGLAAALFAPPALPPAALPPTRTDPGR